MASLLGYLKPPITFKLWTITLRGTIYSMGWLSEKLDRSLRFVYFIGQTIPNMNFLFEARKYNKSLLSTMFDLHACIISCRFFCMLLYGQECQTPSVEIVHREAFRGGASKPKKCGIMGLLHSKSWRSSSTIIKSSVVCWLLWVTLNLGL